MDNNWHTSTERLLQRYGDESSLRESLHRKSFYAYKTRLSYFALPVIVLSVLSGSVQFMSKSYPAVENILVTCTGSVSILTAILSAVQSYLKLGESMSKHEAAEIAWQGLHNRIKHQLSLARKLREDAVKFLEQIQQEYSRLFELSPILDQEFISQVKASLRKKASPDLNIPNYLNGFAHTQVFDEWKDCQDNSSEDEKV